MKTRGVIPMVLVLALAVGGTLLAGLGWKHYSQAKAPAELAAAEARVATAKAGLVAKAQEDVHKGNLALDRAPASREREVAELYFHEGQSLLDQAAGAPSAPAVAAWSDLVGRLLSENAAVRAQAETEQKQGAAAVKELSDKLAAAETGAARAEAHYREAADEGLRLLAWLHRAEWLIGGVLGLYLIGRILTGLDAANPVLAGLGGMVNRIVAPELQKGYAEAQAGLKGVGTALGTIKARLPEVAKQIVPIFNGETDAAHQAIIGRAAAAAHQKILSEQL